SGGGSHAGRISGPAVRRQGGAHGGFDRSYVAYAGDRGRFRQREGRTSARRVRAGASEAAFGRSRGDDSGERAAVSLRGAARGCGAVRARRDDSDHAGPRLRNVGGGAYRRAFGRLGDFEPARFDHQRNTSENGGGKE